MTLSTMLPRSNDARQNGRCTRSQKIARLRTVSRTGTFQPKRYSAARAMALCGLKLIPVGSRKMITDENADMVPKSRR